MIPRCNESVQSEVEFVCFSLSPRAGDGHLSPAELCLCVRFNDLGSLWDTATWTGHVAKRGQQ